MNNEMKRVPSHEMDMKQRKERGPMEKKNDGRALGVVRIPPFILSTIATVTKGLLKQQKLQRRKKQKTVGQRE